MWGAEGRGDSGALIGEGVREHDRSTVGCQGLGVL